MLFNRLPVCGLWFYDAVYSWQELPHRSGRPPSLRRRPALPGFQFQAKAIRLDPSGPAPRETCCSTGSLFTVYCFRTQSKVVAQLT